MKAQINSTFDDIVRTLRHF